MYELTVTEPFVAQHYLTVPNLPADGATPNDHPDGNPSAERPARALFDALADVDAPAATELTVAVHEDDVARVSYSGALE
ncbi:hypothetical protein EKH57_03905 [Halorubrum sp. BOL3-1]|uniref:hypothetical protein n=1 Tax=Halorubrum sp. BOL3-1 TaxID=2497325 RepID=UPI0010050DAA|nr:hypothetical protein [Halorubrum sp. BOL3-1]QAU11962.1 hypothetical protein EKH57_03905 [Halorubrum sp. BOL3-1]